MSNRCDFPYEKRLLFLRFCNIFFIEMDSLLKCERPYIFDNVEGRPQYQ